VVKDVLGKDLCWSIRGRVVKLDVEWVVSGGCRVIQEEGKPGIVGIFVLLVFTYLIIVDGGV